MDGSPTGCMPHYLEKLTRCELGGLCRVAQREQKQEGGERESIHEMAYVDVDACRVGAPSWFPID